MLLIQSCTFIHNPDGYPQVGSVVLTRHKLTSAQNSPFASTGTSVKYFPGLSAQTISITAKTHALHAPSSNTDSSKCIFHSLPQTVLMRQKQVPVIKSGSFFKAYNIYFISILMLIEKRNIFVEFQIQNLEGF